MFNLRAIANGLVARAKEQGAFDADAVVMRDRSRSICVRHGVTESIDQDDGCTASLRIVLQRAKGLAQAGAYSNDISQQGLARLVAIVVEMAAIAEADPDAVAPSAADHPTTRQIDDWQRNHRADQSLWPLDSARSVAAACEQAALTSSSEISNSEGASASSAIIEVAYSCADGFVTSYQKSRASLSISAIAGRGSAMQQDYAHHQATTPARLHDADALGQEAAQRAVQRLGATQAVGGTMTVLFEPRVAVSLVAHLAAALNGRAVLQQRSFLGDAMGMQVVADGVHLVDDPDHQDGLGNRLFDGEGSRCQQVTLVNNGILHHWMCDRYAAGRLGVAALGHGHRSLAGNISIGGSNLLLQSTSQSCMPAAMIAGVEHGILVHELMGFGVNGVTGDYSRGASGTLIEDGVLTRPVQEMTLAGNLKLMLKTMQLANDLTWFGNRAAPTIAIAGMQVAGGSK